MSASNFSALAELLRRRIRALVRSGEITERGLSRLMGYSQPHVHNVMANVRSMNLRFADDALAALDLTLQELISEDAAEASQGRIRVPLWSGALSPNRPFPKQVGPPAIISLPETTVAAGVPLAAMQVADDEESMRPTVCPGDILVADLAPRSRFSPALEAIYVLKIGGRGFVRRCQQAGPRLLILSEQEGPEFETPHWLDLDERGVLDVVKGRVVWLSRSFDSPS